MQVFGLRGFLIRRVAWNSLEWYLQALREYTISENS
jgi:hypothetical protein